jgi:penicillin amidase
MQFRGDMAVEWASYGADIKPIAEAFVRGVNAWVTMARRDPPEEFVLAGWAPEFWKPEDLLNRTDAFLQSGDADLEAFRVRLIAAVGTSRANELLQRRSKAVPFVVFHQMSISTGSAEVVGEANSARRDLAVLSRTVGAHCSCGPGRIKCVGNSGTQSATGVPLVAKIRIVPSPTPSLRYLIHLNAPGWNVAGAVSPWLPGVAIGPGDPHRLGVGGVSR